MKAAAVLVLAAASLLAQALMAQKAEVAEVLSLRDSLEEIPFGLVVEGAAGVKVLPVDPGKNAPLLSALGRALDAALAALNTPDHPMHGVSRVNEASRFVEDEIREAINRLPGWSCTIPLTAMDRMQRSGYPDLRVQTPEGRVLFLDPKLFDSESRESSLRTFYYEPRELTGKIHEDAIHLLVGIEHDHARPPRLVRWELVDLSRVTLRLKAEFQQSNKGLYRPETIVARSEE